MDPEKMDEFIHVRPVIDNICRSMNDRVVTDLQTFIYYRLITVISDKKQGFDFHIYNRASYFFMKDE